MGNIPRARSKINPAFGAWQPRYLDAGIATFPVTIGEDGRKVPGVRNYLKITPGFSRGLVGRFGDHQAMGFACGRRSGITVLDVDTAAENVLADSMLRHGPSPIIVRTASGKFHAWYRANGERRRIRPWRDLPIDLLGDGGYVVAPPSCGTTGRYQFIQGDLDLVGDLPRMQNAPADAAAESVDKSTGGRATIRRGERNRTLFKLAQRQAPHCDDFDALLDCVATANDQSCEVPLGDAEIVKIAKSAWKYQQQGRNFAGTGGVVVLENREVDALVGQPDALALMMLIRRHHNRGTAFALAKAMASSTALEWTLPRFKRARSFLLESGFIVCVDRGGRGVHSPPLFKLVKSTSNSKSRSG